MAGFDPDPPLRVGALDDETRKAAGVVVVPAVIGTIVPNPAPYPQFPGGIAYPYEEARKEDATGDGSGVIKLIEPFPPPDPILPCPWLLLPLED